MDDNLNRCPWCLGFQLYRDYHDNEWGVPVRNDQRLFEKIVLEGAQAGLSWATILKKRENYRKAFNGFDAEKMAAYDQKDIERLMTNAGIIRNRAKINAAISNAKALLRFKEKNGSFSDFIWGFVDHKPIINHHMQLSDLPAVTPISEELAKALKSHGFKFIGATTCYAFMQSVGLVNDHLVSCFRHKEVTGLVIS